MNFQKIAVLTGLSVASVLASGIFAPAHAILTNYTISNGGLSDGGTLSGSFAYDPSTNIYSAFNLSVTPSASNSQQTAFTYTLSNSTLQAGSSNTFFNLQVNTPTAPLLFREVELTFNTALNSISGATTNITPGVGLNNFQPSRERTFDGSAVQSRGVLNGAFVTAAPVPFETDALPIVGATIAFGAAAFTKRKIAQAKSKNLNLEPVKSECLSNVG